MPEKRYIKQLNGFYIKDEEARARAEDIDGRVDTTNTRIDDIDRGTVKFHAIAASSATYIAELPNGKNILIDTGTDSQWNAIKSAVDSLNITKFDYVIITHFHSDHYGNIQNFIDYYDCAGAEWYVQMKPDFVNHASDMTAEESLYDTQMALLARNNIIPTVPANYSEVIIDEENGIKLKFYNTDATIAEDYYGRCREWTQERKINLNDFSLMTEIIHGNVKILSTGDIERPVEDYYFDKLGKINLLTAPHHGINVDGNRAFYQALSPDYTVCLYPTTSSNWIQSYFKSFGYIHETGSKIITSYGEGATNSVFTFVSDGYSLQSLVKGGSLSNSWYNYADMNLNIHAAVNNTSQLRGEITLKQLCENIPEGYTIRQKLDSTIIANYATVISDLQDIFPFVDTNKILEISRLAGWGWTIKVYDANVRFECTVNPTFAVIAAGGNGNINYVANPTRLAEVLPNLPVGHYSSNYYQDTEGDVLTHGNTYAITIDVTLVDANGTSAVIMATARSQAALDDTTKAAVAYYRESDATMLWRKLI